MKLRRREGRVGCITSDLKDVPPLMAGPPRSPCAHTIESQLGSNVFLQTDSTNGPHFVHSRESATACHIVRTCSSESALGGSRLSPAKMMSEKDAHGMRRFGPILFAFLLSVT